MGLETLALPVHWKTRAGTWDVAMWDAVVIHNEYQLDEQFTASDVCIDVGAHIGSFSWLAIEHGFGQVFAFEVDEANFELLKQNVSPISVLPVHAAVWRSDKAEELRLGHCSNSENTGGHCVVGAAGATTTAVRSVIPFDEAVYHAAAASPNNRVRYVKMDCEGSEFPILYTCTTLDLIDEIVGEYHAMDIRPDHVREFSFNMVHLADHLESAGFTVTHAPHGDEGSLGLFRAKR